MQLNDWCICKVSYYSNRPVSAAWLLFIENTRALWENGYGECNALEDEWLVVQAKEDEISLFEKLNQNSSLLPFIKSLVRKPSVFSLELKRGKQRGKSQTLDLMFFSVRKAMATLSVGDTSRRP